MQTLGSTVGDHTSRQRAFFSLLAASIGSATQLGFWLFAYAFCSNTEFSRLNIAWAAGYGLGQFLTLNEHRKLIDHPEILRQMLTRLVFRFGLASFLMSIAAFLVMNSSDRIYALLAIALAAQYLLQLPGQSMAVGMRQVRFELLFRLSGPVALLILGFPLVAIAGLSFLHIVIGVIGVTIAVMLGLIVHLYGCFLWPRFLQVHSLRGFSTIKSVYLFHVAMDASLYPALFFILSTVHAGQKTELGLRLLITVSGVLVSALTMHAYMHRANPLVSLFWHGTTWLVAGLWLGWALEVMPGSESRGVDAVWALWMAIFLWQLVLALVGVLSLVLVERRGQSWFSSRAIVHHALVASVALWIRFAGGDLTQDALSVLLWLMSGVLLIMVWPPVKKERDEL